jgi:hypothetical protein
VPGAASTLTTRAPVATAAGLLLPTCAALYGLFAAYLIWGLGFDPVVSDALGYWQERLDWRQPFSSWWMPGYSLTLAFADAAAGQHVPPQVILLVTAGTFFVLGAAAARALARELGLSGSGADVAAVLTAVSPFVGLSYSAYPVADGMACTLVLAMLLALTRQRWGWFALAVAACLVTHKATWYFVLVSMAIASLRHRPARLWSVLGCLPLGALWLGGAFYHDDVLWMVRWSAGHLIASRGTLPVLDGAVGSLFTGEPVKLARGAVVLTVLAVAAWVAVTSWRTRLWVGLATALPILAMGATLNQYEIWAAVRFSRPLVVPAVVCIMPLLARPLDRVVATVLAIAGGVLTNVAYGAYLARAFSGR